MLDILLGVGLLAALGRGYSRGLARGAIRLAVMVAAVWFGYRTGPAMAGVIGSWTGTGPLMARTVGSIAVFLIILVGGTFLAKRSGPLLGPLRPLDRIAGSLLSGAWFVVATVLVLLVAGAAPKLPARVEGFVSGSRAASLVTAEAAAIAPVVSRMLGDRLLESFVNINRIVGKSQVVVEGDDRVEIPPVTPQDLADRPDSARELFENLNLARIKEGVAAVSWSVALADLAGSHGQEMYEDGYFSHVSPSSGSVDERLLAEGIPFRAGW